MPPSQFVVLPSAEQIIESVGTSSAPLAQNLLPIAMIEIGFAVGGLIVVFLIMAVINGFRHMMHGVGAKYDQ